MHTLLFFAVGLLFAGSDVSCSTDSSNSTALSDTALNATAVRNKVREDARAKLVRGKIEISDDEEDECSGCEEVHAGTSQCECTVTAVVSALSTIIVWCVTLFSANKAGLKKKFFPKKKKSAPPIVLGNVATMDISV
ncbi:hypothetical protein [European catfish virus]|uniref:Uncharacterized protein n=1 Tax=European catfish virus TaxID=84739 RepID=I2BFJ0_9VIRU|nr:hypothetical protein A190_gp006 [European catfish virus]AFJ52293.1 hypothetical protein [European catfish virus]AMZ04840.1 hypothetical protein [European catfish virus]AMZ04975.1 hypothetical protein [European catfish virus]